jgi:hypothetical protein
MKKKNLFKYQKKKKRKRKKKEKYRKSTESKTSPTCKFFAIDLYCCDISTKRVNTCVWGLKK